MFNRTHIWFSSFVLIVFAAGVAAGVALDRGVWHGGRPGGPGRDGGRGGGRGSDGPPTEAFVRDLDSLLDLSPDQEAKVAAIINASRPQMRALQDEASKKFSEQQKSLRDEIVKVLTPDQAKKFGETPRGPFGFRWRSGGRGGR